MLVAVFSQEVFGVLHLYRGGVFVAVVSDQEVNASVFGRQLDVYFLAIKLQISLDVGAYQVFSGVDGEQWLHYAFGNLFLAVGNGYSKAGKAK